MSMTATGPRRRSGSPKSGRASVLPSGVVIVLAIRARVVGEHVGGRGHDRRRAPVVDLEGVGPRAGEVVPEVDQVLGCRSRVAVDDLVVVADGEGVVGRGAQEPDQQHVGGVEVLELVDQQVAAACLRGAAGLGIGAGGSRWRGRSARRSRRRRRRAAPPGRRRSRRPGRWRRGSPPRPPPVRSGPDGRADRASM